MTNTVVAYDVTKHLNEMVCKRERVAQEAMRYQVQVLTEQLLAVTAERDALQREVDELREGGIVLEVEHG